ncbi:hypothetical protein RF11_12611 [Thelohanellus kitauei]|uniref:Uncharacterized protein n=1 Tax=Thelohanellus kitauei TaxID=669202 RepID=A0A0C2MUB9_THEKT|nr:hypothetical protein RF11_12611 [Thelohanellus kitauei]
MLDDAPYLDEELSDSYSKSEIFLMPPFEKKLIHIKQWFSIQRHLKWINHLASHFSPKLHCAFRRRTLTNQKRLHVMVKEKMFQFLMVAVSNQIRLFGKMEDLLGPARSTNALSAESDANPSAEVAAIRSKLETSLAVEERLSRMEDAITRMSMPGTGPLKQANPP